MGFFGSLFKTEELNADPQQQALAKALINAVENNGGFASREIFDILHSNGWSRRDQGNRLVHAASMAKVWRADLYPKVKELSHSLYMSL
jgi:hypothetical protein